jgi:peptidoglycan hydrolase-like protein with peptidoglycan-binding domain
MMRVSVLLSPRLAGDTRLGSYDDFLFWTRKLQNGGAKLTLNCNGSNQTVAVPVSQLRPDLWELLFTADTPVIPYQFDDYTGRLIISYPARQALFTIKSLHQLASGTLALPASRDAGHRRLIETLTRDLQVFWNKKLADDERSRLQDAQKSGAGMGAGGMSSNLIGGDGLPTATSMPPSGTTQEMARRFSLFHHIPAAPNMTVPSSDSVLDFHTVLTSLSAYPPLLRALGLVLDVELPRGAVPDAPLNSPGEIFLTDFARGEPWTLQTEPAAPHTAYINLGTGGSQRVFLPAPAPGSHDYGLLGLDSNDFALGQIDVDGALHKAIILAETVTTSAPPLHEEVFDPTATLPSLRSAGLALLSDDRALKLLAAFDGAKAFNDALEAQTAFPRPFSTEDLVRGYRLDIWDATTNRWYSLHRRTGVYAFGDTGSVVFTATDEEGFTQLAVAQAAPDATRNAPDDLYLSETIARWNGWSLSAPHPGRGLARNPDPLKAIPPDDPSDPDFDPQNPPASQFKMQAQFSVTPGSLPRLRFGRRYRLRARLVDLAGNSLALDEPLTDLISASLAIPVDPDGFAYLRYEPVAAPTLVLRDTAGVTGSGSAIDRLVIRSFNTDPSLDTAPPNLTACDRHVVPPRSSVEMAERHGLFDTVTTGAMMGDPATHDLIADRDAGQLNTVTLTVAGKSETIPLESAESIPTLPYLPDPLARGAALRDLPGTPDGSIGTIQPPFAPGAGTLQYTPLPDANPRPGSATLIGFGGDQDWRSTLPFRLAVDEGNGPPRWDAIRRVLTVFLAKGATGLVPLSSYMTAADVKLMGVWQWLREYADALAHGQAAQGEQSFSTADTFAHIIQRAVEGGHWMLTPPRLLTLVHAVQQPIGRPGFVGLRSRQPGSALGFQTEDETGPTAAVAFNSVTAWRTLGAIDAYLVGGLRVHGLSTGKVDLIAEWDDPVDTGVGHPGMLNQSAHADELPLHDPTSGYLRASGPEERYVGYYNRDHDVIWFAAPGDELADIPSPNEGLSSVVAPRHHLNDSKHHVVRYRAIASSRFRDYFPPGSDTEFTRASDVITVDVPASARPAAPHIVKVLPTFGWERQTSTNLKSSVRFGGGLRVYLDRPWFSSGEGELLGVTLWNGQGEISNPTRESWKHVITQWGVDPIWQTTALPPAPQATSFPDAVAAEKDLSLAEGIGPVSVAGHAVQFDEESGLWYCDLTVAATSYTPFIRLALARYQPHALDDAKLSRVVLADFAQLTPDRAALVTADPYHPRRLRVSVSGPGPRGPVDTQMVVSVQRQSASIQSDVAWEEAPSSVVQVVDDGFTGGEDVTLWSGSIVFVDPPAQDQYRLLIREYEYLETDPGVTTLAALDTGKRSIPGRLIYADIIALDNALVMPPPPAASETKTGEGEGDGGVGGLPDPVDPDWDSIGDPPLRDIFDFGSLPSLSQMDDLKTVDGHVKLAQAMLNAFLPGPPLTVDGNFGPLTLAAVQTFQTGWLLPVTGVIDTNTWFMLALASPFPLLEPGPLAPPMAGPPVAQVQQLLNLAGASPQLSVDGSFTPGTQATLQTFQTQRGLASTGPVGPDTWAALAGIPAEDQPSGTMRLTFSYDSEDWAASGPLVRFVSREDLAMTAPLSDDLDTPTEGMSGFWYELQDAQGLVIYRRGRHMPIAILAEVPSDDQNPELVSIPLDAPKGTFQLLAPILPRAQSLVLFSSPLDANQMDQPATVIASFDLSQLTGGQP